MTHLSKNSAIINAWQSAEEMLQQRAASTLQSQEQCGTTVLGMLLAPVNVKAACDGAAADPQGKTCTRVSFLVVRVMDPGWSNVPANAESAALIAAAGKNAVKKGPMVKLAERYGADHCLVYSYNMLKRGVYQKGLRTDEAVLLSPGMVFTLKVWTSNIAKVFKGVTANELQPFDMVVAEVMLRSVESAKVDEKIDLKSINALPLLSPACLRLFNSKTLLPETLHDAAVLRSRYTDGSHLEKAPPAHMKQEWLAGNLAATVCVVRATVTTGSFAISADDQIHFHIDGNHRTSLFDAIKCGASLPVKYDARQFQDAPRDWVVAFLNIALMVGAVELLIAVDTYQGKDSPVHAFARVHVSKITAALLQREASTAAPPAFVASAFPSVEHVAVYDLLDGKMHIAFDTRAALQSKKPEEEEQRPRPTNSMVHPEAAAWTKGYNALVFIEKRLVFHFIFIADNAATSSIAAARGLQTIAPPASLFSMVLAKEDGDEEEEEEEGGTTAPAVDGEEAPQEEEEEPVKPQPTPSKKRGAGASSSKRASGKRQHLAADEPDDE